MFDHRLDDFIRVLDIAPRELKVYHFLEKRPMTIKQLQSSIKVSERMLRIYLSDLMEKKFIKRSVIESRRLKYVYTAASPADILRCLKSKFSLLEKNAR